MLNKQLTLSFFLWVWFSVGFTLVCCLCAISWRIRKWFCVKWAVNVLKSNTNVCNLKSNQNLLFSVCVCVWSIQIFNRITVLNQTPAWPLTLQGEEGVMWPNISEAHTDPQVYKELKENRQMLTSQCVNWQSSLALIITKRNYLKAFLIQFFNQFSVICLKFLYFPKNSLKKDSSI